LFAGCNFEEFQNKLTTIVLKPNNQAIFTDLCHLLDRCEDQTFFAPISIMFIQIGLKAKAEELFLKAMKLLMNLTKSSFFWRNLAKVKLIPNYPIHDVLSKIIEESNFMLKQQLTCQAYLLLWNDVISKLPTSFISKINDSSTKFVESNDTEIIQELFLLLIDMTFCSGSEVAVKHIQKLFQSFVFKAFVSPFDVLSFLAKFCLHFLQKEWDGKIKSYKHFKATLRLALNAIASSHKAIKDPVDNQVFLLCFNLYDQQHNYYFLLSKNANVKANIVFLSSVYFHSYA